MFPNDQSFPGGLVEGYYLHNRDRQKKVGIPVHVWFGPPADPFTGELLDRSPRWQVALAGKIIGSEDPPILGGYPVEDIEDIWPRCTKYPIDKEDYDFLTARREWAREHSDVDPHAGDIRRDPLTTPLD